MSKFGVSVCLGLVASCITFYSLHVECKGPDSNTIKKTIYSDDIGKYTFEIIPCVGPILK